MGLAHVLETRRRSIQSLVSVAIPPFEMLSDTESDGLIRDVDEDSGKPRARPERGTQIVGDDFFDAAWIFDVAKADHRRVIAGG